MTDMMSGVANVEDSKPATGLGEQFVAQLVSSAAASGLKLSGEGGMLQQSTKLRWSPRSPTASAMTSTT
ncbi:hypothetical protein AB0M48_11995 [Lentzea sp. NPDC051208]|uniref:hypothetical protein n=1 Tax=Lentzea sp. NPDC051208 TaxID=3154642 RepID=UPI0034164B31